MTPGRLVVAGVVLGGLIASFVAFWPFTVDDSYITYRYAENLANGFGLRWNPDGEVVEGYTAFLWVVVLAVAHTLQLGTIAVSKVLGVVCALLTIWTVVRLVWRLIPPDLRGATVYPALAAIWLTLSPEIGWHAVSGMDTAAFMLVVTWFGLQWIHLEDAGGARARRVALTALLMGLVRPDGNLLAVVTFATAIALRPDARSSGFVRTVLLYYVFPGAIYFALRAWYFGHLLPIPFAIKVGSELPGPSGVRSVLEFARHHVIVLFLALVTLARAPRRVWPLGVAVGAFLSFYLVPTHIMGYGFRFLIPVLPLLVGCATAGVSEWIALTQRAGGSRTVVALFLVALMGLEGLRLGRSWPRSLGVAWEYADGMERAHLLLGRELRAADPTGASLVAMEDAGAISYVSGWRSLDLLGLNDASIAFGGFRVAQVTLRAPDVVVLVSRRADRYTSWGWDHEGLYPTLLEQGMAVCNVLTFRPDDYYLYVLSRPEGPSWSHLRSTLPLPPSLETGD